MIPSPEVHQEEVCPPEAEEGLQEVQVLLEGLQEDFQAQAHLGGEGAAEGGVVFHEAGAAEVEVDLPDAKYQIKVMDRYIVATHCLNRLV